MKKLYSLLAISTIAVALVTTGCNRISSRTDADVSADVQKKLAADSNIQSKQIQVSSTQGVVSLNGTVSSDLERFAAANDAGQIEGVKTVINNLQTPAMAAQNTTPDQSMQDASAPALAPSGHTRATSTKPRVSSRPSPAPSSNVFSDSSNSNSSAMGATSAPPAPPVVQKVTIPDGTQLSIRLTDSLSSETNHAGDSFRASLEYPIYMDDKLIVPKGADVEGKIVDAKPSTHFSGSSALAIELTQLSFGGKSYNIQTSQWSKQGTGRGKNTAVKVGGGAAVGAVLGGVFGGGKGAAIGAAAGAGAGTAANGVTKGQKIELASEASLQFALSAPLTVTPSSSTGTRAPIQP